MYWESVSLDGITVFSVLKAYTRLNPAMCFVKIARVQGGKVGEWWFPFYGTRESEEASYIWMESKTPRSLFKVPGKWCKFYTGFVRAIYKSFAKKLMPALLIPTLDVEINSLKIQSCCLARWSSSQQEQRDRKPHQGFLPTSWRSATCHYWELEWNYYLCR